jgi:hypothetical protein
MRGSVGYSSLLDSMPGSNQIAGSCSCAVKCIGLNVIAQPGCQPLRKLEGVQIDYGDVGKNGVLPIRFAMSLRKLDR